MIDPAEGFADDREFEAALHDPIKQLEQAVAHLAREAQQAADAAERRGDEIDVTLATLGQLIRNRASIQWLRH